MLHGWLLQLSIILGSLTGSSSLILQHTHNESLHAAEIFPPPLFAKPKQPEPHVSEDRVFIVVLGHGQEERSKGLTDTLWSFKRQLGRENFDCIVFVWNPHMKLPDVPPGCEIKVTPGVFMEYTRQIPEDRLRAAKYTYLMADDVTLDAPGHSPMDITQLRDLAAANCLDVLTPAQYGANYLFMKPNTTAGQGRMVQFSDWQGNLVTPTVVHMLRRLASSKITGCWSYDSLMFSALKTWTGRQPRLGIADELVVNVGHYALSETNATNTSYFTQISSSSEMSAHKVLQHPCGKITLNGTKIEHTAAFEQMGYWARHSGLADYRHTPAIGLLEPAGPASATKQRACASMLFPGELV
mmetsp:Transcript_50066/g.116962  ORF Transcript_50066/g.116962 Transcript_50066/m.116962 type:complete len:355 (+) Transcript_50066:81-1145(+)